VLASLNMSSGATCEYLKLVPVYVSKTPREMCDSSFPSVRTNWPRFPMAMAVPVSWQPGRTKLDAMLAFLSNSSATKRSFSVASGSLRMLLSCCKCAGRSKCAISVMARADNNRRASGSTLRNFVPPRFTSDTWLPVIFTYSVVLSGERSNSS
jgi:hypothetical protein